MPNSRAGINIAGDYLVNHRCRPAYLFAHPAELILVRMVTSEILSRRRDVILIQTKCDLRSIAAEQCFIKNSADYLSSHRVQLELVSDCRMKNVAIGRIASDIFALLHHLDFGSGGFDREVFAVCRIDNTAHNNLKSTGCPFVVIAVIPVIDGYEADTHEWEGTFEIVSRFNVITRKTGEVLDADQVDLTALDLFHHLRELRTMKVCPGITVIRELKPRIF